jgi:hypothetical protein
MRILITGVLLLLAAPLPAQVIDQQQPLQDTFLQQAGRYGIQSFRPSANTVAGAGVLVESQGIYPVSLITIELFTATTFSDDPDIIRTNPNAILLASGTVSVDIHDGEQIFADVFWTPVAVIPGTEYFLRFRGNVSANSASGLFLGANGNPYSSGVAYRLRENPYSIVPPLDADYTFREYASTLTSTPEPGSLVLMGTGLFVLIGAHRRRQNQHMPKIAA